MKISREIYGVNDIKPSMRYERETIAIHGGEIEDLN